MRRARRDGDAVNAALERFLADREGLEAGELDALADALRADPAAAVEARALLQLDELLARRHAGDRGHFAARVATRLATVEGASFVRRMHAPLRSRRRRAAPRRWAVIAGMAAALILAVVGAWSLRGRTGAILASVTGQVARSGATVAAGTVLRAGDELTIGAGTATVAWPDGTSVELGADSRVAIEAVAPKRMRLEAGTLSALVAKQPVGAPMTIATRDALATVVGTRLRMTVGRATRLDVLDGRVGFAGSGGELSVGTGEMAECELGKPPRAQPRTVTVAFGATGRPLAPGIVEDHGDAFTVARGYGWERRNDGSAYPDVVWQGRPRSSDRLIVEPFAAPDPLHASGLSVGWAKHAERWRMAVPDGRYDVVVVVGGTAGEQGPHRILVQGRVVIDDVITAAGAWHEATTRIEVSDGWLRLEAGDPKAPPSSDGSSDTILCFLRLTAAD